MLSKKSKPPITIEIRGELLQYIQSRMSEDSEIEINEAGDFLNTPETQEKIMGYTREFFQSDPDWAALN